MVRLDRIYTRRGDRGMTSLGDGTRVPKTHPRIAAYGCVDEVNTTLGVALLQPGLAATARRLLRRIQNDLFDVGADLCVPRPPNEPQGERLRVAATQASFLETAIDGYTAGLAPLHSFILPGGTAAAAWLHLARVVCRRAELAVAALGEDGDFAAIEGPLVYLNRLSDLLFVMARWANRRGRGDVLWEPGAGREGGDGGNAAGDRARRSRTTHLRATRSRRPVERRGAGTASKGTRRKPQRPR
jgi:cob(I)alamin adenosyltransferase